MHNDPQLVCAGPYHLEQVATSIVSCSVYRSCFASKTLGVINTCLNGQTHGPVHILTGGQWLDQEEEFIAKTGKIIPFESIILMVFSQLQIQNWLLRIFISKLTKEEK